LNAEHNPGCRYAPPRANLPAALRAAFARRRRERNLARGRRASEQPRVFALNKKSHPGRGAGLETTTSPEFQRNIHSYFGQRLV